MKRASAFTRYGFSVALVAGVASTVRADPVGNPGEFEFDLPAPSDACLMFQAGGCLPLSGTSSGSAFFTLNLDSAGNVSHAGTFLPYSESRALNNGGTAISTLQWTTTTGTVDIQTPEMEIFPSIKVRFTVNGFSCTTNSVQVKLDMGDFGESHCPSGGYNSTTGEFCMASSANITIPALAASACNNRGNDINITYGLGVSGARLQLWDGVVFNTSTNDPILP